MALQSNKNAVNNVLIHHADEGEQQSLFVKLWHPYCFGWVEHWNTLLTKNSHNVFRQPTLCALQSFRFKRGLNYTGARRNQAECKLWQHLVAKVWLLWTSTQGRLGRSLVQQPHCKLSNVLSYYMPSQRAKKFHQALEEHGTGLSPGFDARLNI